MSLITPEKVEAYNTQINITEKTDENNTASIETVVYDAESSDEEPIEEEPVEEEPVVEEDVTEIEDAPDEISEEVNEEADQGGN